MKTKGYKHGLGHPKKVHIVFPKWTTISIAISCKAVEILCETFTSDVDKPF